MKSKFELPESIFSVTKGLPSKTKKPFHITQNSTINANAPPKVQLHLLAKILPHTESNSPKYLKVTKWLAIIGLAAITLSLI